MPGPLPKDPKVRQRANKTTTRATLAPARRRGKTPKLPEGDWHPMAVAFWRDVWASPMADEYLDADVHGLYLLTELVDRFWRQPTTALAAEIRQQRLAFGLTPIDRRRLEWTVAKLEKPDLRPPAKLVSDPRAVLKAIS